MGRAGQLTRILAAAAALVFNTLAAQAQGEDACAPREPIPGFTEAKPTTRPPLRYPKEALNEWSEGWVLLELAVAPDGTPRNITVIDAIGPKDFVKTAVKGIGLWRFDPATRNGAPVEQPLFQTEIMFRFRDAGSNAADHDEFVSRFNKARVHVKAERPDEAIAILEEAFRHRLNLYEAAMGSYVLAVSYALKADWERAHYHIKHARLSDGEFIEKPMRAHARALEVELDARNGDFDGAVCGFRRLREIDPSLTAPGGDLARMMGPIEAAMEDPKAIAVDARLTVHPLVDGPAVWRHRLLRSKFWFAEIKGEVKAFRLACRGTAHEDAIDPEVVWNVPKKAGGCILRVEGAPGATFKLVEEW